MDIDNFYEDEEEELEGLVDELPEEEDDGLDELSREFVDRPLTASWYLWPL